MRAQNRGFTLVETIVVLFVFSLLLLSLTQLMKGSLRAYHKGATQTTLKTEARSAIDVITSDFRQGSGNTSQAIPGDPTCSGAVKSNILQIYRWDNNGSALPQIISYTIDPVTCNLIRLNNSDNTQTLVAENVFYEAGNPKSSYFKWDTSNMDPVTKKGLTLEVNIYVVEEAKTLTTQRAKSRQELGMATKIMMRTSTTASDPVVDVVLPTALYYPGGFFRSRR
jgi:prepilin-type N-terminal cleavage/methylation domain-containing protein